MWCEELYPYYVIDKKYIFVYKIYSRKQYKKYFCIWISYIKQSYL